MTKARRGKAEGRPSQWSATTTATKTRMTMISQTRARVMMTEDVRILLIALQNKRTISSIVVVTVHFFQSSSIPSVYCHPFSHQLGNVLLIINKLQQYESAFFPVFKTIL